MAKKRGMAKKRTPARRRAPAHTDNAAVDFLTLVIGKFISDIFTAHRNDPWSEQKRRLRIGAAGGLVYAGLKGLIYEGVAGMIGIFYLEPGARWQESAIGFLAAIITAAVAGAAASWLTAQKSGRMQFVFGMVGLQLLVSLFPGLQAKASERSWLLEETMPISVAYAANGSIEKCVGDTAFEKGFKTFFGARERYEKYAVVVASGTTRAEAQAKANAVKTEDPTLKLRVGPRACDNDFYPVLATDYLPLTDAKPILEKVRKLKNASDAYLTPGPKE